MGLEVREVAAVFLLTEASKRNEVIHTPGQVWSKQDNILEGVIQSWVVCRYSASASYDLEI